MAWSMTAIPWTGWEAWPFTSCECGRFDDAGWITVTDGEGNDFEENSFEKAEALGKVIAELGLRPLLQVKKLPHQRCPFEQNNCSPHRKCGFSSHVLDRCL